jgi:SAM-dependent methyltransferase
MSHSEVMKRTLQHGTEALYRDGRYYDHIYRSRRHDVRFYVEMARRHGGPVLELGCGTGRVTLALAREGFEVVGVDALPSMLEQANAKLAKLPAAVRARVELRRGDLRRVRLRRRFALVIAPFNVFMHLYERRDVERALATCHTHLRPRGRLAFAARPPGAGAEPGAALPRPPRPPPARRAALRLPRVVTLRRHQSSALDSHVPRTHR